VATKTNDLTATDKSMEFPKDWDSPSPTKSNLGHQEAGRTIVLHSVAILPQFQGRGLGRVLMQAYIQQMNGAGIADRLALIAHDVSTTFCDMALLINCSIKWVGMRG
jgi:GNAT superfamily N-acetyltransferase